MKPTEQDKPGKAGKSKAKARPDRARAPDWRPAPKQGPQGPDRSFSEQEVIDALRKGDGIKSQAARILGCSRGTVTRYIEAIPTIAAAYHECTEALLDRAESVLVSQALDLRDQRALEYLLNAKGRSRGYGVTRSEVNLGGTVTLRPEDRRARAERVAQAMGHALPAADNTEDA